MKKFTILLAIIALASASLSVSAQNLLTNGGFESGNMSGWTYWSGWGGAQGVAQTADKVSGNYSAKLSASSGSFGYYQTVNVTAGTRYKVDGMWKGSYTGTQGNWFEVILIDGLFSLTQADNGTYCVNNFISAYDPANFPTKSFGWESISAAYATTPYITNGERTATGNKMTLVIKTGGFGSPTAYFDNMSLQVVPEPSGILALGTGALGILGLLRRRR